MWDVRRRTLTRVRTRMLTPSLAFSPDGRLIAAAVLERGFQVRDARSGKLVARLPSDDRARSVAFAPDGELLAAGQLRRHGAALGDRQLEAARPPLEGHEGRVLTLNFSPDGRTLASSSEDGTVLLRDVATLKPIGSALTVDPDTFVSSASHQTARACLPSPTAIHRRAPAPATRQRAPSVSTPRSRPGSGTRAWSRGAT